MEDTFFEGDVVGTVLACRGPKGCRGSMSWKTPSFGGGCRGDCVSMSWMTAGMSWKHVVGARDVVETCRGGMSWRTPFFEGDVVGTVLVCRGRKGCRGSMSWKTPSFGGMSWGRDDHVVGDRDVVEACRGGHPFSGGMSWRLC